MTPQDIVRDFRTKYTHTYVFVKSPDVDGEVLAYIQDIAEDNDKNAIVMLNAYGIGNMQINLASTSSLHFRFPPIGTFQYGRDSVVVTRRPPHRQYQRGLCVANHTLQGCLSKMMKTNILWGLPVVKAMFDGKKSRPQEAIEMLMKDTHRSVALGGRFSLCQPTDRIKGFMLFNNTDYVGRVSTELEFSPAKGSEVMAAEARRILLDV